MAGQKTEDIDKTANEVVDKLRSPSDVDSDSSSETGVQEDSPSSDSESEEQRVPYSRFDKVNKELQKLREELKEAQSQDNKSNVDKILRLLSKKADEGEELGADIPEEYRPALREALLYKQVTRELPDLTSRQTEAVVKVLDSLDNRVSASKAMILAKEDNPGLWRKAKSESEDTESKEPPFQGQKPGAERGARTGDVEKERQQLEAMLRDPRLSHRERVPLVSRLRSLQAQARRK